MQAILPMAYLLIFLTSRLPAARADRQPRDARDRRRQPGRARAAPDARADALRLRLAAASGSRFAVIVALGADRHPAHGPQLPLGLPLSRRSAEPGGERQLRRARAHPRTMTGRAPSASPPRDGCAPAWPGVMSSRDPYSAPPRPGDGHRRGRRVDAERLRRRRAQAPRVGGRVADPVDGASARVPAGPSRGRLRGDARGGSGERPGLRELPGPRRADRALHGGAVLRSDDLARGGRRRGRRVGHPGRRERVRGPALRRRGRGRLRRRVGAPVAVPDRARRSCARRTRPPRTRPSWSGRGSRASCTT